MTALLFGSISTIADTSELQRQSFNDAFAQHGLDWTWDQDDYRQMLQGNGGRDRVAQYAKQQGVEVDADAVHATKSELFQQKAGDGLEVRPGVAETLQAARDKGIKVGLVTTTSPANVAALLEATGLEFDLVVDKDQVQTPKPDGASYRYALDELGEDAIACVAVEDNVGGIAAAQEAGIAAVAFPNQNTAGHDFTDADDRVETVSLAGLEPHLKRSEA